VINVRNGFVENIRIVKNYNTLGLNDEPKSNREDKWKYLL